MKQCFVAEIRTGVSADEPVRPSALKGIWASAVDTVLGLDPDLRRRVQRSQEPIVCVRDREYVALLAASPQPALFDRRRRAPSLQAGLFDEQLVIEARLAESARRVANIVPRVRDAIEREANPVSAIAGLEPARGSLRALTKRVVTGAAAVVLETAGGERVCIDPGHATRRSVLLDLQLQVRLRVHQRVGSERYQAAVQHWPAPEAQGLTCSATVQLLVPGPLASAKVMLEAATHTRCSLLLQVAPRQTIIGRQVVELVLCAVPDWGATLDEVLANVPALPALSSEQVAELANDGRLESRK